MSERNHDIDLTYATEMALRSCGADILGEPRRFLAFVIDYMDEGTTETRVLERHCDERLLEPYRVVVEGRMRLEEAIARTEMYLTYEHLVDARAARLVACGLANGVVLHLGLVSSPSERVPTPEFDETPRTGSAMGTPTHPSSNVAPDDEGRNVTTANVTTSAYGMDAMPPEPTPSTTKSVISNQGEAFGPTKRKSANRRKVVAIAVALVVVAAVIGVLLAGDFGLGAGGSGATGSAADKANSGAWLCTEQVTKNDKGQTTHVARKTYDEHGNLMTHRYQYDESDYWYVWEYDGYDEYGHARLAVWSFVYEDGALSGAPYEYAYEYDLFDDGRIRSKVERCDAAEGEDPHSGSKIVRDGSVSTTEYTYDGTVLTKALETEENPDDESEVHTYERHLDAYGHITFWNAEHKYSPDHSEVIRSSYKSECDYELDGAGIILRSTDTTTDVSEDGETAVEVIESEHDEHENVVKETKTSNGKKSVTEYENTYDEHGNVIMQKNLTEGDVTTYSYIYVRHPSPVAAGDIIDY